MKRYIKASSLIRFVPEQVVDGVVVIINSDSTSFTRHWEEHFFKKGDQSYQDDSSYSEKEKLDFIDIALNCINSLISNSDKEILQPRLGVYFGNYHGDYASCKFSSLAVGDDVTSIFDVGYEYTTDYPILEGDGSPLTVTSLSINEFKKRLRTYIRRCLKYLTKNNTRRN